MGAPGVPRRTARGGPGRVGLGRRWPTLTCPGPPAPYPSTRGSPPCGQPSEYLEIALLRRDSTHLRVEALDRGLRRAARQAVARSGEKKNVRLASGPCTGSSGARRGPTGPAQVAEARIRGVQRATLAIQQPSNTEKPQVRAVEGAVAGCFSRGDDRVRPRAYPRRWGNSEHNFRGSEGEGRRSAMMSTKTTQHPSPFAGAPSRGLATRVPGAEPPGTTSMAHLGRIRRIDA